jgi:catalase
MLKRLPRPEVQKSDALSLTVRPGAIGIKTRRVAIIVADGVDGAAAMSIHKALADLEAVPRFVGIKMGQVDSTTGDPIEVEVSLEAAPAVVWDAMIVPDGAGSTEALSQSGHAREFLKDQYRHCKPILLMGAAAALHGQVGIPSELPTGEADPGLLRYAGDDVDGALPAFVDVLTKHRVFERETDPPRV